MALADKYLRDMKAEIATLMRSLAKTQRRRPARGWGEFDHSGR